MVGSASILKIILQMKNKIRFGWSLCLVMFALHGHAAVATTFTNSLGLRFVSIPKLTNVMFCTWLTRVQDFRAFVSDHTNNGGYDYTNGETPYIVTSNDFTHVNFDYGWYNPGFTQRDDCPVVCVSWYDAQKFCLWLTRKERAAGIISTNQRYRLPTDAEWSIAAGLEHEAEGLPADKNMGIKVFAWGTNWPPPPGAGNFGGEEAKNQDWFPPLRPIAGYNDGFPRTSPVGSFPPDRHGLYDFTGNAGQWCEDIYHNAAHVRVWRGGNWICVAPGHLWRSTRGFDVIDTRNSGVGFRLVLFSAP